MKKLCLDAGHGDHDSGAVGPKGLRECDVALKVVKHLMMLLEDVCEIILTRNSDRFISLTGRADFANRLKADLFLSIHLNSGPEGEGSGFEVWTSPGQTESDRFATYLYQSVGEMFPMKPRRQDTSDGDPDKESKFTVLTATKMPAVLFELEFIHTPAGEKWLSDDLNLKIYAQALARGVRDYLGLSEDLDQVPAKPVTQADPERLLEVEMLAILSRAELKSKTAFETAKTELDTLFRK